MPKTKDKRIAKGPIKLQGILDDVSKPAYKKNGFIHSKLINEWTDIVGIDIAKYSYPEKLHFTPGKRSNGTLHIQAISSIAIALQHMEPLIIEKIATYFGYQAVSHIKLKQVSTLPYKTKTPTLKHSTSNHKPFPELTKMLEDIHDPVLQEALEGLGKNVLAQQPKET